MLFFKCMATLLNPVHRREKSVKWGLVSYTVVMFSVATILTAVSIQIQSICYIDNREFLGVNGLFPPGPLGYLIFISHETLNIATTVMFALGNWLTGSLLVSSLFDVVLRSPTQVSNAGSSPSSIVATLSTPRTSGSSSSLVSYTSAPWVRV